MTAPETPQTIVFFDGVCHLCNGFVDFAISRDRRRRLHFAPLQGSTARRLLPPGIDREAPDSVLLWSPDALHRETAAIARVLTALGGAWAFPGFLLRLVPGFIANPAYRFVARNRYRWFGRREMCRRPTPAERGRLLD